MDHKRRRKKMKTSTIVKIVISVILVAAILTGLVFFFRNQVKSKYSSTSDSDIKSASVESSSISTTVYGTGRLSDDNTKTQEVPDGVTVTEVKVEVGDKVTEGQELALVNLSSVMTAMSETQASIDSLDKKLKSATDDEIDSTIKSTVAGRIKKIYIAAGDDVSSAMVENSALILMSVDGYMAVDVEAKNLSVGDKVSVTTSNSKKYTGTVDSKTGNKATVVITDDGTKYGDEVTVSTTDGSAIGTGTLYIHDQFEIVGFAGTVKSISVSENQKVSSGKTLITLKNTSYTANYEKLLSQRRELEATLLSLVEIYRNGSILADYEGTVRTVPTTEDEESSEDTTTYFGITPDKTMSISVSIDETDILSLSVGQKVDVTVESVGDDTFEGEITAIDKTGTSSDGVTTFTATVQIDKVDGMLSGMSASASITIESVENALIIPLDALKQTSSTAYVYTSYDEESGTLGDMKEVEIGISNSSYVEITSGLSEGDVVYYQEKKSSSSSNFSFPGGGDFPGGGSFPGGSSSGGSFPGGGNFPSRSERSSGGDN